MYFGAALKLDDGFAVFFTRPEDYVELPEPEGGYEGPFPLSLEARFPDESSKRNHAVVLVGHGHSYGPSVGPIGLIGDPRETAKRVRYDIGTGSEAEYEKMYPLGFRSVVEAVGWGAHHPPAYGPFAMGYAEPDCSTGVWGYRDLSGKRQNDRLRVVANGELGRHEKRLLDHFALIHCSTEFHSELPALGRFFTDLPPHITEYAVVQARDPVHVGLRGEQRWSAPDPTILAQQLEALPGQLDRFQALIEQLQHAAREHLPAGVGHNSGMSAEEVAKALEEGNEAVEIVRQELADDPLKANPSRLKLALGKFSVVRFVLQGMLRGMGEEIVTQCPPLIVLWGQIAYLLGNWFSWLHS